MSLTHRIFAQSIRDMRTMPASDVDAAAARLLTRLLDHAASHVPYYAAHGAALRDAARGDAFAWHSLPILSAREIAAEGPALVSTALPDQDEWLSEPRWTTLSTPTDDPVDLLADIADKAQWEFVLRDAGIDATQRLAAILPPAALRSGDLREPVEPWSLDQPRGRAHRWSEAFDPRATLLWLRQVDPAILFLRLPILHALLDAASPGDVALNHVLTCGAPASPATEARCLDLFGARFLDVVTTPVGGFVASRASAGHFLPATETAFVEIVDGNGNACPPGEAGRLVTTALYGYGRVALRQCLGLQAAWISAGPDERRLFRIIPPG